MDRWWTDGGRRVREAVAVVTGDRRSGILLAVAVGWFLSLGVRLVYPALLPYLRESFALDLTLAGALVSVLWIAYAVGQLPGGLLSDRFGEGSVLVASTGLSALFVLAVSAAWNAPSLFLATAGFGLATAFYGPVRFTILSDIYGDRAGTAIGLTLSAGEIGNATLPVAAGLLAAVATWRLGFGATVPLFVLVAVWMVFVLPKRTSGEGSAVDSLSSETVRYVLSEVRRGPIVALTGVQLIALFAWQGFTGFYPTYLVVVKGFSPPAAAGMFGLFFAAGIGVQVLAGAALDRFGAVVSLPPVLVLPAVALATLTVVEGTGWIVAATIASSLLVGVTTITQTTLATALPSDMQGTGLGLIRTVFMLLGASSPIVVGSLADVDLFDEAFLMLAVVCVLGLGLLPFVTDDRHRP